MFKLVKGATSVELKLSVPGRRRPPRDGERASGFDPVEAQPRQAFLLRHTRPRLEQGRRRRPRASDPGRVTATRSSSCARWIQSTIDPDLRRSAAFKVEVDAMPGGFVCSASFKGTCTGQEVRDVTSGTMPLRKLFSKEQRAFFTAHAPAGITMDKLVILGPTFLLKAKHQPKDFDRPIVVEMWLYPDGARVLEVSTKCLPKEAFEFGGQFKNYLAAKGIVLGTDQSAKTKNSLEYFSARLESVPPLARPAGK
jgi:hypothetical protein